MAQSAWRLDKDQKPSIGTAYLNSFDPNLHTRWTEIQGSALYRRRASDQHQSLLFRLPVELRMQIFEFVLLAGVVRHPEDLIYIRRVRGETSPAPSVLCMLATCRAVYQEAVAMFYEKVHICFERTEITLHDKDFFKTLSRERLDSIGVMHVTKVRIDNTAWVCKQLKNLANLQYLSFTIHGHEFDSRGELFRRIEGNKIGLLRSLCRMEALKGFDLMFKREYEVTKKESEAVMDFVTELRAVTPHFWSKSDEQNDPAILAAKARIKAHFDKTLKQKEEQPRAV